MRKSRGEERRVAKMVSQRQGAAMKGFQLVLSLILPSLQGTQVKATETSSIHPVKVQAEWNEPGKGPEHPN